MSWRRHRERSRIRPDVLGALVILGLFGSFYLAATKHLPFVGGGHTVHLEFASANQIAPNAPVRIAGVDVGKVESIDAGPNHTASVTVSLDDQALPLHTDSTARIRPRTFLEGAFFLDLRPGSPSAPVLHDGGTIPVSQTSDPVQLDQVLTTLQPDVRQSLRTTLLELSKALAGGGAQGINRTIPALDPLFRKSAVVSDATTGTEPNDLSRAIESSSRVTAALAQDPPRLGGIVRDFSTVAAALASRQRQLAETVSGFNRVLADSPPTLDAIHAATPPARGLVDALRPFLRKAPSVIDPSVPLAGQVQKLLSPQQLPALVSEGAPTVRSLAASAPDAIVTFAGLRGPVSCVLHDAVPTLTSTIDDGALSSGQPIYRELLYDLTGLASATRNFDGNGFGTRYYAGFGDELVATPFGDPEGRLFGFASQPIIGSRPRKPGVAPPLRPDVPCTQDARPDLHAATGPGGFSPVNAQVRWAAPPGTPTVQSVVHRLEGAPRGSNPFSAGGGR